MLRILSIILLAMLCVPAHAQAPTPQCGGAGQATCPSPYLTSPLTFRPSNQTIGIGIASPGGTPALGSIYASPTALYQFLSGGWTVIGGSSYTLPVAQTATLGGVLANAGSSGQYVSGINTSTGALIYGTPASSGYTLPAATTSTLGGVIVGGGLNVAGDGTESVAYGLASNTAVQGSLVGAASGVTPLGSDSIVPAIYLPPSAKRPLQIAADFPGTTKDGEIAGAVLGLACTIANNSAAVVAQTQTLSAATATFNLVLNHLGTTTTLGVVTFVYTSGHGTYSPSAAGSVVSGDGIYFAVNGTHDTTLADVFITAMCSQ